jgi:hypothetical protein
MPYTLDSHAIPPTVSDHGSIAELLDPFTRQRIQQLAPTHGWTGARILQIGASSIAHWLADQVAPHGKVITLTPYTHHLPPHPHLRRLDHDLTDDQPLTHRLGDFDLIHARLTLTGLPQPTHTLHRLATTLTPGGTVLIEDWTIPDHDTVITAPSPAEHRLHTWFQRHLATVLDATGSHRTWARTIHATLHTHGLQDVQTLVHATYWTGGSPGTRALATLLTHLWDPLLATGMTEQQLTHERDLLNDPRLILHGPLLYSTSARRPH